jgi:hypothetical protein
MMVLKWVIKQGGSPAHGDSTVLHHAKVGDLVSLLHITQEHVQCTVCGLAVWCHIARVIPGVGHGLNPTEKYHSGSWELQWCTR